MARVKIKNLPKDAKISREEMDILRCGQRIDEIVKGLRSNYKTVKNEEQGLVDINEVLEDSLKMVWLAIKKDAVGVVKGFQPVEKR